MRDFRARVDAALGEHRGMTVHEQRDPQVATSQYHYTAPGLPLVERWDASSSVEFAYLSNVYVFACVRAIVNALIAARFVTGRDPKKPTQTNPNSRLAQLLGDPPGRPCPAWTPRRVWAALAAQYLVTGKLGMEIETSDNKVGGPIHWLWPLVSQWLHPIPSNGGATYWDGFKYGRPGSQQYRKTLNPLSVFYHWQPSPDDFRQPVSALQAARLDVDVAVMQDRYMRAFLRNDARPAGIIVTEQFEQDDERQAFRRQWQERYGGPDQAGRLAFVEATGDAPPSSSISYQQLGISQKDAQFIAIYEAKIRNICIGLGVPMSMLDASGRTFSNGGLEVRNFYEETVMPFARDLADGINIEVAPRLGTELGWWDFSHIEALRPPQKFQNVDPVALKRGGILPASMISADLGFEVPPDALLDDAQDTLWRAQAVQALVAAGAPLDAALQALRMPALGMSDTGDMTMPTVTITEPPKLPAPRETGVDRETREASESERRAAAVRLTEQHRSALLPSWRRAFSTLFDRMAEETAKRMRGKRGWQAIRGQRDGEEPQAPDTSGIFDPEVWTQQTANLASGLLDSVFAVAAGRLSAELGISFDVSSPYVIDFLQTRANDLAGNVVDATYQAIKDAMTAGVQAGEGTDAIARRLRTIVGMTPEQAASVDTAIASGASDDELVRMRSSMIADRSDVIARTEVVGGYNGSAYTMGQNLPPTIVADYEWMAVHDERTRESHILADGQKRPKGQPFEVGGYALRYPGDPSGPAEEIIQCRCALGLVPAQRMATPFLERREAADLLCRLGRREIDLDDLMRTLEVAA